MAISVLLSGAVIVVTTLVGLAGAIWVYAVIVFVFYLSPSRLGATVIAVALIGITTVSVGSSAPPFCSRGDDRDSWNRRADQSMYRAKQLGGNRFVVDEELVVDHA